MDLCWPAVSSSHPRTAHRTVLLTAQLLLLPRQHTATVIIMPALIAEVILILGTARLVLASLVRRSNSDKIKDVFVPVRLVNGHWHCPQVGGHEDCATAILRRLLLRRRRTRSHKGRSFDSHTTLFFPDVVMQANEADPLGKSPKLDEAWKRSFFHMEWLVPCATLHDGASVNTQRRKIFGSD
jgi:hypothetical protein